MSPSSNQQNPKKKTYERNETRQEKRAREAAEARIKKKHKKLMSDFAKAKRKGDTEGILKIRDRIRQMKNR
ncbi:hypothetical protein JM79_2733 [Gramella sp. Hel_I_59]|uniref:hypothetical protein n=1 Tax=Gramella sp. Hel_I_59 TaxID=1249978 RepID=UPI00115487AD|nr:hypothetical protein [Gramella sp. Hel_I_59]TQI71785.1 hypothetical protein JM79_2733 [Gramella sp. Hel_I_59]